MRNRARPHSIDKTWDLFEQALKPPTPEPEPMDTKEEIAEKSEESDDGKKKSKKEKKKEKIEKADKVAKEANGTEEENVTDEKMSKKKKKKRDREMLEKTEEIDEPKNAKKRKHEEIEEETNDDDLNSQSKKTKFDWDEVISSCLKQKDDQEMKLVKLKKKCLKEFFSQHEGTHKTEAEIGAKFDKKLKKRCYRVLKDRVRLVPGEEKDEEEEVEQGAPTKPEGWKSAPAPNPALSFNKWEGANLGNSAQTDKFRRLMGIKTAPKPEEVKGGWGRDDKKMLRDLENGFEKARETHFGGRAFSM